MTDFNTARQRIDGLRGLMRRLGDAPPQEPQWKSMPRCPFCGNPGCAGLFEREGTDFFKCFHTSCSSGGAVLAEVAYIALRLGLSAVKPVNGGASPAYPKFLELAGCWEPPHAPAAPAVAAVKPPERAAQPASELAGGGAPEVSDEQLTTLAVELIRTEGRASARLLEQRLHIHSRRATRVIELLEQRGIVGPHRDRACREILELPAAATASAKPAAVETQPLPEGWQVMQNFFQRLEPATDCLVFRPSGCERVSLLKKRGLISETCSALGFKANPRQNKAILEELERQHNWDELKASGLFLEADPTRKLERRPNTQFCGKGQIGKKPEADRRDRDDKWLWGWCEPVLIPYFDENGQLVKLRPHKGGAPAGTVAGTECLYVPRDPTKRPRLVERYSTVWICEGEFKAAALWQALGQGMTLWDDEGTEPPEGVCALPGISFVRNVELRQSLECWPQAVGCQRVYIGFDDEDKSDKPLRRRFDTEICARYLARDLARKLHLAASVVHLPMEWRFQGKADWDGAAAMILNP